MALISIIKDFHPLGNEKLLSRAEQLRPVLRHTIREPIGGFQLKERYSPEKHEIVLQQLPHLSMGRGENLCLDFGEHLLESIDCGALWVTHSLAFRDGAIRVIVVTLTTFGEATDGEAFSIAEFLGLQDQEFVATKDV